MATPKVMNFGEINACRNGRVLRPEYLSVSDETEATENLRDLSRINRWLGGHRLLTGLLHPYVSRKTPFSLLDIGAASGDMGAAVRLRYPSARVLSLDRRLRHLRAAAEPRVVGDAFRLPFHRRAFDFVFCSLLLHEYTDDEVRTLLRRFYDLARRALIVLDLYRHPMAYHFLPATRWLFGWGAVTVHDGPASVEAAFHPRELERLAREAGLDGALVQSHLPWFRLSLVAPR